jgi:recombination DNA repair RAD52 pathway protein
MGVISSKEIRDAEEYDVIGEVERRATEVEKEPPQKGEAVTNALKSAGSGVKSFFTHCGYFITNVKREIKRKKAQKKRQQYEEDRKRRARERAERQRQQAENGGLVQVHKRTDRKPPQRRPGTVQRRPSSQQRRPSTPLNRRGNPPRKR